MYHLCHRCSRVMDDPLIAVEFKEDAVVKKIMKLCSSSAPVPKGIIPRILQNVIIYIVAKPLALILPYHLPNRESLTHGATQTLHLCSKRVTFQSILLYGITAHLATNKIIKESVTARLHVKGVSVTCKLTLRRSPSQLMSATALMWYQDLAKAFEKVPHQRLIAKLNTAGIQGRIPGGQRCD